MPTHDAGAELSMALKNLRREFPGEGAKDGALILEDRQRPPAGGAAGPYSGQLQALPRDLVPHVGQTVAIGALGKRSLAWRYVPFHLGLVLSVAGPRRADDESPVLGVLRKAQGEHRMQGPSRIAVAGKLPVARHWDIPSKKAQAASSPAMTPSRFWYCMAHTPASSRFGTGDDAKATEGSLRRIARRGVLRAHCGPAGLAPIALDHEASQ